MIKFKVSAPGRMILCGKHVIMCKKHVVAASLDLRTSLEFVELINDPRNIIKIEFPDVNLSLNLSLELFQNFFFTNDFLPRFQTNILLLKHVQYFITINGLWSTYEQRYSLQTFLFLFLFIAHIEKLDIKSFHVHLTIQLPINAGFGSSTSFAVCLAACFLHWSRLQKSTHNYFNDEELRQIMSCVIICDKDVQNYWIIDPNVCIFGQVLRAQYENPVDCNIELLQVPKMEILFIDSGIRHNKYEQIMIQMTQMKQSNTDQSIYFLYKVNSISMRIYNMLIEIINCHNNNNLPRWYASYTLLRNYISSYQNILYRSGLSHPKLDTICSIAKNYGFEEKLTGFYGYAYILLPPDASREDIRNLSMHLVREDFTVRLTSVSCNDVKLDEE